MKKLMFVAAVAAAMTGFADVTSANIVGYNNQAFAQGTQYKGPQFVAIGEGKMSDVKVSGYTGDLSEPWIYASKLNAGGVNYKDLLWLDVTDEGDPTVKAYYGWYQLIEEPEEAIIDCNDDPLTAGECLMIQIDQEAVDLGCQFTSAGEVAIDGLAYTLAQGTQYLACAVPRDSTFGEVTVSGYLGDLGEPWIYASKLNAGGVNYKDLLWLDVTDEGDPTVKAYYGWYQLIEEPEEAIIDCNDDELSAGEGLMVQVDAEAAGLTMTFSPAIPEKK